MESVKYVTLAAVFSTLLASTSANCTVIVGDPGPIDITGQRASDALVIYDVTTPGAPAEVFGPLTAPATYFTVEPPVSGVGLESLIKFSTGPISLSSHAVVMLESPTAVRDSAAPPVFVPSGFGFDGRIVSDIIVRDNGIGGGLLLQLVSDGGLLETAFSIALGEHVPITFVEQTGAFQDLTTALGSPTITTPSGSIQKLQVLVFSEISPVPEPVTTSLLGVGLVGLGIVRCKRARARKAQ